MEFMNTEERLVEKLAVCRLNVSRLQKEPKKLLFEIGILKSEIEELKYLLNQDEKRVELVKEINKFEERILNIPINTRLTLFNVFKSSPQKYRDMLRELLIKQH